MYYCEPSSYKGNADTKTCAKCGGSGLFYGHGSIENGRFTGKVGKCYACGGKGKQTRSDAYRNRAWVKHNIGRLA
jgi:DnaJ-class molecular chaperone